MFFDGYFFFHKFDSYICISLWLYGVKARAVACMKIYLFFLCGYLKTYVKLLMVKLFQCSVSMNVTVSIGISMSPIHIGTRLRCEV